MPQAQNPKKPRQFVKARFANRGKVPLVTETPSTIDPAHPGISKLTPDELGNLLDDFCKDRYDIEESTRRHYSRELHQFFDYLAQNNLSCDPTGIEKYVRFLYLRQKINIIKKGTIGSLKTSIRVFLQWAYEHEHLDFPQVRATKHLKILSGEKTADKPHIHIPTSAVSKLLQYLVSTSSLRELLEVLIPLTTGTRPIELVNLRKRDFDLELKRLDIRKATKNRSARKVPLPDFLIPMLNVYLQRFDNPDAGIFPSRERAFMSRRTFEVDIEDFILQAKLDQKYVPHDLRVTFATNLYMYGDLDLLEIQQYMGHKSSEQTRQYIRGISRSKDITLDDLHNEWKTIITQKSLDELNNARKPKRKIKRPPTTSATSARLAL